MSGAEAVSTTHAFWRSNSKRFKKAGSNLKSKNRMRASPALSSLPLARYKRQASHNRRGTPHRQLSSTSHFNQQQCQTFLLPRVSLDRLSSRPRVRALSARAKCSSNLSKPRHLIHFKYGQQLFRRLRFNNRHSSGPFLGRLSPRQRSSRLGANRQPLPSHNSSPYSGLLSRSRSRRHSGPRYRTSLHRHHSQALGNKGRLCLANNQQLLDQRLPYHKSLNSAKVSNKAIYN